MKKLLRFEAKNSYDSFKAVYYMAKFCGYWPQEFKVNMHNMQNNKQILCYP